MNALSDGPLHLAGPDDVEALAFLWAGAFPSRGAAERARELREGGLTYGSMADCWVARDGGVLVGALRTYRLSLHARGRVWPTMGLAGVAVAPDHQGRGLGGRMCVHALQIGRERGSVLSALYPFRSSFYATIGYRLVGSLLRYRFAPADLPVYPGWERVTRGRPADVHAVYQLVAKRSTGLIDRPEMAWRFLSDSRVSAWVHMDTEGRPTGYAVTRQQRSKKKVDRLRIVELLALDRASHEALLGWVAAQQDRFPEVVYDALPGEGLDHRLRHARRIGAGRPRGLWMDSAALLRGPMLRLLDPSAVQSGDAAEGFALRDDQVPENSGYWKGGRSIAKADSARDGEMLGPGEAAERFLAGTLPGQIPPPEGWPPIPFGEEFRLLDEF